MPKFLLSRYYKRNPEVWEIIDYEKPTKENLLKIKDKHKTNIDVRND
jgi:hypothetical protein